MTQSAVKSTPANQPLITAIANYWNDHIHDLEIATEPIGSAGFFRQLDDYRYDKLRYMTNVIDFDSYKGKTFLEVGCGAGIDLVRFARAGAIVTGIDLAPVSIELAEKNFANNGLEADLRVMNGEATTFDDNSFDVVYAHGVLQYTADADKMMRELHRVVKPGGEVIVMVYNRISWLNAMSALMKVGLEHEDAPVLEKYSIGELKEMMTPFRQVRIVPERFPVESKLHKGWKALLFNKLFVKGFNLLPRSWVRPYGWHIMAFATK